MDRLLKEIAISKAKGVRSATLRQLIERIGGVDEFFSLSHAELRGLTGIDSEIFTDDYRRQLLEAYRGETDFVRRNNIDTYLLDSENYPHRLAECEDAPAMLYKIGSCDLDSVRMVGIVGTRHATHYGVEFTNRLVADLASKLSNLVIVSGLAYGIDVTAHKAAMQNDIPTAAVVAHGLNMIYPADHRDVAARMLARGGAIVSEYTTDERIHRSNFLERNRIVAGLCDCLVVVESDLRGGSMSTARIASQYNREVFAVPGRTNDRHSRGTNALISRQAATLLTDADQLIETMGWQAKPDSANEQPTLFRPLSADEQAVAEYIRLNPESTVNDLCVNLGKTYSVISGILFQMEMDDLLITLPGGRFALTI